MRKEIDRRTVAPELVGDPTFVPRMNWWTPASGPRDPARIAAAWQVASEAGSAFFIDSSFVDDTTTEEEIAQILRVPGRLHIIEQVRHELSRFFERREEHPIARAIREVDSALVLGSVPERSAPGRLALEFYVPLLAYRRKAAELQRDRLAEERGQKPEDQDYREVLDRVQRFYGDRGRLLAEKPWNPLCTDEFLAFQAVEHAVRSGQPTVILTKDADVQEQFFKLTWLLSTHYKSMLAADRYVRDFASFRTVPVSDRYGDASFWPIHHDGAVLVDRSRWGLHGDELSPQVFQSTLVSCWNVGPSCSQTAFAPDRALARVLDVKDRTRGRSTDQLGARNCHFFAPDYMRPSDDPTPYMLIARDHTSHLLDPSEVARPNVPLIDIGDALLSHERPRRVVLESEATPSLLAHFDASRGGSVRSGPLMDRGPTDFDRAKVVDSLQVIRPRPG